MSPLTLCFLLMASTILVPSAAKRVVFIPFFFTSHTKYHTNAARALAKLGHQVWVTIPTYLQEKGYLDVTGFDTITYETLPSVEESALKTLSGKYFEDEQEDFAEFMRICRENSDFILKNEAFTQSIRETNPDLIVIDNIPVFYTTCVIPYRLGVPFAFLGSVYYPPKMRIPFSPAETPINLLPVSNKMTFTQRLSNAFLYVLFTVFDPVSSDAVARYAPEMPYLTMDTLVLTKAEVWLVETDHILDYPKATLPNVKLIGGAAAGPAKRLPPDFQSFMDGRQARRGHRVLRQLHPRSPRAHQ